MCVHFPPNVHTCADRQGLDEARPTQYVKGPDVASKSERTRQRYKNSIRQQTSLEAWGFKATEASKSITEETERSPTPSSDDHTAMPKPNSPSPSPSPCPNRQCESETMESLRSPDEDPDGDEPEGDLDEWECEAEVFESISCAQHEIRDWGVLRDQIKLDLKKKRDLPLSKINQLLILRNFATLRLKGYHKIPVSLEIARQWHEKDGTHFARKVRSLARHYQLFEQLPRERRGGARKGRTLLLDETLKATARDWLSSQKTGDVTPRCFQHALNSQILPSLNIALKKPLCERTARRWLIKLGWRLTQIRKGVYLDGHEREDVVTYRNEEFLPRMKEFEARMTCYLVDKTTGELVPIEPTLSPGQKKVIPLFQDESSFHANEYKSSAWFVPVLFLCMLSNCAVPGFVRERSCSRVNPVADLFMSRILSMKSMDA